MRSSLLLAVGLVLASNAAVADALVRFHSVYGDLYLALFDDRPGTTQNFLQYVDEGAYNGGFYHRYFSAAGLTVIQGGGFRVRNRGTPAPSVTTVAKRATITNEFHLLPRRPNVAGTIAMAKGATPDSASSQFFLNLADNSGELDNTNNNGGFTVFGQVIGGTHPLATLATFRPQLQGSNLVVDASAAFGPVLGPAFKELPVYSYTITSGGSLNFGLEDLVFLDISRTNIVAKIETTPELRVQWNPIPGATNRLELSRQWPPVWEAVADVVPGPGDTVASAADPQAQSPGLHLYRVRLVY